MKHEALVQPLLEWAGGPRDRHGAGRAACHRRSEDRCGESQCKWRTNRPHDGGPFRAKRGPASQRLETADSQRQLGGTPPTKRRVGCQWHSPSARGVRRNSPAACRYHWRVTADRAIYDRESLSHLLHDPPGHESHHCRQVEWGLTPLSIPTHRGLRSEEDHTRDGNEKGSTRFKRGGLHIHQSM